MCGIAGILDLRKHEPIIPRTLKAMTNAMAHRGPDGEGYYIDDNLGLAHRRLAIIDPTPAGHQPMLSDDGRFVVCFNGTIYNYRDLRRELEGRRHRFRSNCDTEVLIHGFEEWGENIAHRLNGHFAFLMWDSRQRQLTILRDRFGTKPLYYANLDGLWLFASEIKAILTHPAYNRAINHDALYEYFTFQNLFRFHTLFKDIYLIPQANVFRIDARTGESKRYSYWDFDFTKPDNTMTEEEASEETKRLLAQSVERQLFSDVPVGAYLSGGMDSASIVTIAAQKLARMYTFTCGWHMDGVNGVEAGFDERERAEVISQISRTQHFEQVIGSNDVRWILPQLVYHLEDLRLGMSYGNYYIARLASKFVKVCLAGAGGDELFGGYPWRYYRVARSLDREEYYNEYYLYWQRLIPDDIRHGFFSRSTSKKTTDTDMKRVLTRVFTFHRDLAFSTPEEHIANSLYFESKTFMHSLLLIGDKLAMGNGLEERFPFLDNDLVDFAQIIPIRLKLKNLEDWKYLDENLLGKKQAYFAAHDDGKNVLREAMRKIVPEEIIQAKKQGFSSPDESWYRGPNLEYITKMLLNKETLCHEYIQPRAIRDIIDRHSRGQNMRLLIWSLTCFELWLNMFMNADSRFAQHTTDSGRSAMLQPPRGRDNFWCPPAEKSLMLN